MAYFEDKPDATEPIDLANVVLPGVELDGPTDVKVSLARIVDLAQREAVVHNTAMSAYTLQAGDDRRCIVILSDYSSLTIPENGTVDLPLYCRIPVVNASPRAIAVTGAGAVTIVRLPPTGYAINVPKNTLAWVVQYATDVWGVEYQVMSYGIDEIGNATDSYPGMLVRADDTGYLYRRNNNDTDWDVINAPGVSDPYGMFSDVGAPAADEFDDASIDGDWILTQPSSGTIVADEGNHKLSLSCGATTTLGLFVRPLSTFGGAWSDGVSIVESTWTVPRGYNSITRANFCVTDGTGLGSTAAQINISTSGGASATALIYQFLGTASNPFGGGYTDCGNWFDEVRGRILSLGAGSIGMQVSVNGANWVDIGSPMSIGFTPTHVGFLFGANSGMSAFSSEYVRRIA